MRWSSLALLLAACPKQGAPPPVPTPPVPAPAPAAVDMEAVCPTSGVAGFQVRRGEASGPNAGEAIAAARAQAVGNLERAVCTGVSEVRCAAILQHVKPWREGHFDPAGGWACASVSVDKRELASLERDAAVFESQLRALASTAAERAERAPLQVRAPTWASGCSSGPIGQAISAALFNQLASFPDVRLIPPEDRADAAARMQMTLAPASASVTLSATLARPKEVAVSPLPGFSFPPDLFEISQDEVGRCRGDQDLGLSDGERVGAGGLRVTVDIPGVDGEACEGLQVEPIVSVNRAADVQVYSVAQNGRSLLVWPPPGVSPRVEGSVSLGALTAVAMPKTGDERLVAVALPVGARWGDSAGWTGLCEVEGGIGPKSYPTDAAVGTATFTVTPEGTAGCQPVPGLAAAKAAIQAPPRCGR